MLTHCTLRITPLNLCTLRIVVSNNANIVDQYINFKFNLQIISININSFVDFFFVVVLTNRVC